MFRLKRKAGIYAYLDWRFRDLSFPYDFFQPLDCFLPRGGCGMALNLLNHQAMTLPFIKSKRILIPDVPPPSARQSEPGLVIAGIGILCTSVSVVVAAMLFVFLGA